MGLAGSMAWHRGSDWRSWVHLRQDVHMFASHLWEAFYSLRAWVVSRASWNLNLWDRAPECHRESGLEISQ